MQPIPYLFFPGNCAEAMRRYAEIFDAPAPEVMTPAQMPQEARDTLPEGAQDAVMHAALKLGDGWLFASDNVGGDGEAMAGASIHLSFPTAQKARTVFDALAEGGTVRMAMEPTFWAPAFGTLTDRFGTRWMISADNPAA
ncbi:VOC family protein [Brevirhabdus sp.]|uniref:VOC family protein n=1 Tax=Brevirhabdus sp. TaxID=2004514 RepID=UPI00405870D7